MTKEQAQIYVATTLIEAIEGVFGSVNSSALSTESAEAINNIKKGIIEKPFPDSHLSDNQFYKNVKILKDQMGQAIDRNMKCINAQNYAEITVNRRVANNEALIDLIDKINVSLEKYK